MDKKKARFVVGHDGSVKDRRLELEAENYRERELERIAKAKQFERQMENQRHELLKDVEQKFLKQEEYKQSKNGVKLGSLICVLGAISLEEAVRSGSLASGWGLIGLFLILFGGLLLVVSFLTRAGAPPE